MNRPSAALRAGLLALASVAAAGCLSSDVLLTVHPDGTGTIRQSLTFRPSAMAELDALVPPDPGSRPRGAGAPSLNDQRMLDFLNFGPSVRTLSAVPDRAADRISRSAEFEFDDVSKVVVDLVPHTPLPVQGFLPSLGANARTRLTFELSTLAGGARRLTIRFPRFPLDPSAEPPGQWATGSAEEIAALKRVFKDARIRLAVAPATPIVGSNSPHRTDAEVVLFEMDVQAALFSRQIDMLRATPSSFDELLVMLADLPGVTLAHDHVVTIDFRGAAQAAPAQQAPPDTEIYLAPLTVASGKLSVGTPRNITNSPGYDNQPSFAPDGRSLYFSSARGAAPPAEGRGRGAASAGTDIYRYDIAADRVVRITTTPEAEYSPGLTPDGKRLTVVRVEADGTQRLWSFTPDGGEPALVLSDVKPVGYYAWAAAGSLALFVLGQEGRPSTLQVADVGSGSATIVAERIGRSIQRMPSGAISFVQQPEAGSPAAPVVKELASARASAPITTLVPAPAGVADPQLAWMADGTLLTAGAGTLYRWKAGDAGWTAVADLAALGLGNVSRLAVSPKGDWLALVTQAR